MYKKNKSSFDVNNNFNLLPLTPLGNKHENVIGWDCYAEFILTLISKSFSYNI